MPKMELATTEPGFAAPFRTKREGHPLRSVHDTESLSALLPSGELWTRHGGSIYALACTLLGDEEAAIRAVALGLADFARSNESPSPDRARRSMARHVYWRSGELADVTSRAPHLPPAMVGLGQLAQLQRACLALCVFGGHNHREAAGLLGVPPQTVAEMLTAGLRELGRLATAGPSAGA